MEKKQENKVEKITFNKQTILSSKKYRNRSDLLNVLLEEDKRYTYEDVDKIINSFMKGVK